MTRERHERLPLTGIQIEDAKAEATADFRSALGINTFAESRGEIADPRNRQ